LLIVGALKFANSLIKSRGRPTRSFDYLSYVGEVLYGNGHIAGGWAPLWFLPHLFVSSFVALLIINLTESTWHLSIVSLLSLAIGASVVGSIELPWGADLVPISLAFLLLGYLCRDYLQSMRFDALYFGLALCVFAGCHVLFHATIDLNERVYGEFPIATLQALTGIYLSLSVSTLLTQLGILSAALCYLGSSTLFILLFHAFVQGMSFGILSRYLQSPYPSAILSFLLGVSVPLAMREVVKRVELSRLWFSSVRH
jgi:fucose 4-O-acetylase-like acetyltransferase